MSQSPSQTARPKAVRRARATTANGPQFGVVGSALFHALILAATYFSLSHSFKPAEESHVVPVDLVTIADQTNVAAQAPPTPPPEKMDMPPSQEVQPLEPHLEAVEPAPVPPIPKFKVEKDQPDDDNKPKSKKDQQKDLSSLLDRLTAPDKPVKAAKAGPRVITQQGLGNAMTANIADALRAQIRRCWSLQIFPPNPADAVVDYDVQFSRDGRVISDKLLTMRGNTYTNAAAEAARRALYSCQPYSLPQDKYDIWSEVNPLRFDPRDMLNQ
jgi:hypothetical protein